MFKRPLRPKSPEVIDYILGIPINQKPTFYNVKLIDTKTLMFYRFSTPKSINSVSSHRPKMIVTPIITGVRNKSKSFFHTFSTHFYITGKSRQSLYLSPLEHLGPLCAAGGSAPSMLSLSATPDRMASIGHQLLALTASTLTASTSIVVVSVHPTATTVTTASPSAA